MRIVGLMWSFVNKLIAKRLPTTEILTHSQFYFQSIKNAQRNKDDDMGQEYLVFMQNLETMGFIIKETMSLNQLLDTLSQIYSRDLQKQNDETHTAKNEV